MIDRLEIIEQLKALGTKKYFRSMMIYQITKKIRRAGTQPELALWADVLALAVSDMLQNKSRWTDRDGAVRFFKSDHCNWVCNELDLHRDDIISMMTIVEEVVGPTKDMRI